MPSTTGSKLFGRGDVVLVPFPFTDLTGTKQRPALVVQVQSDTPDMIVLAITSRISPQPALNHVRIPADELGACGLPKASIVKTGKIFTIHKDLIRKRIGSMPAATLERILTELRKQFS